MFIQGLRGKVRGEGPRLSDCMGRAICEFLMHLRIQNLLLISNSRTL
jgi:hypothetical protein